MLDGTGSGLWPKASYCVQLSRGPAGVTVSLLSAK